MTAHSEGAMKTWSQGMAVGSAKSLGKEHKGLGLYLLESACRVGRRCTMCKKYRFVRLT